MKILMNLLCSTAVALSVGGCCCGPEQEHPFPQVEDAVVAPALAKNLKSVKIIFSVEGDELPDPATFTIRAALPASARFDFETKGAFFSAGFHNHQTWGYDNASGIYKLTPEEDAELCSNLYFIPLALQIKPPYEKIQWVKDETVDGEEYSCFRTLAAKGAPELLIWVDRETNLVWKLTTTDALAPAVTVFSNYKEYDGVKLPSTIYLSDPDDGFCVMHVESVEWNLPLQPAVFESPAPLKK